MAPSAGTLTPPHSRVGHLFLSVWTVDAHFGLGLEPDAMLLTELFDVFRLGPRELSRLTPLPLGHAASCGVSCVSPAPRAAPGSARTSPAGVSGSVPSPGARLLPWKKGETRAGMRMAAGRPSGDSAGAVCVCVGGGLACVHTQTCERVRTWPSAPRAGTLELPRASPALIRHHNGRSRLLSLPLCHVPSTERRLRPPSPSLAWLSSSRASGSVVAPERGARTGGSHLAGRAQALRLGPPGSTHLPSRLLLSGWAPPSSVAMLRDFQPTPILPADLRFAYNKVFIGAVKLSGFWANAQCRVFTVMVSYGVI